MDANKVDMFFVANKKMLPVDKLGFIRDKISNLDDSKSIVINSVEFKDPTTILIVSLFLGHLGIDRFMIGDKGMGFLKLFTFGCCGILTFIDWFIISKRTRERNFRELQPLIF